MKLEPINDNNRSYLRDESRLTGTAETILFPETPEEVCSVLKAGEKLTLQGARTGFTGGAVPMGGSVLNLSRLTEAGKVEKTAEGGTMTAQCGVTLETVDRLANAAGLRFPPDPTEQTATLGGMFAAGATGPNSLRFGPCSRWISGLTWATPQGELWQISRGDYVLHDHTLPLPDGRTLDLSRYSGPKSLYEGMDLIDFLSGTEGYLGAALSLDLTLIPKAGDLWGVVFFFRNPEDLPVFGRSLLGRSGLNAAELYDQGTLSLLDAHRDSPLLTRLPAFPEGARAALYVELEGESEEETTDALMELLDAFASCGGSEEDTWAENGPEAVRKFRDMRHAVPSVLNEAAALHDPRSGCRWELDLAGKPEDFPRWLSAYQKELAESGLKAAIYGHLLENRLRVALLPETEEDHPRCADFVRRMTEKAVDGGGPSVTEYEVGKLRRKLLGQLLGAEQKAELEELRGTFDPDFKMNP